MKKQSYPIETFLLFILPLIIISLFFLFDPKLLTKLYNSQEAQGLSFISFFLQEFIYVPVACILYAVIKLVSRAYHFTCFSFNLSSDQGNLQTIHFIKSLCYLGSMLSICLLSSLFIAISLFSLDPKQVIVGSLKLMDYDYALFGISIPIVIQKCISGFISQIIIFLYHNLSGFTLLIYIVALLNSKLIFRRYLFCMTFAVFLAFPLWLIFPAVSPLEMFYYNIFKIDLANYADFQSIAYQAPLLQYFEVLKATWSKAEVGIYAISSFPSMHVIWSTLSLYFSYQLSKRILFPLFLIIALGNYIGIVYTLQHYAVDLFPALLICGFVIYISEKFISTENNTKHFYCIDVVQEDYRFLSAQVRHIGNLFRGSKS